MTTLKRGRPKLKAQIQKEDILQSALDILDKDGPQGLSMRNLAGRLKVTPMALYHHVADRSALLREISDWVYSGIVKETTEVPENARERIEDLLLSYHKAVIQHPNLTLSIFADPDAFSVEAQRITQYLVECLAVKKIAPHEQELWLDILVDFTHGSSMATAMNARSLVQMSSFAIDASERYARGLKTLLDCIF